MKTVTVHYYVKVARSLDVQVPDGIHPHHVLDAMKDQHRSRALAMGNQWMFNLWYSMDEDAASIDGEVDWQSPDMDAIYPIERSQQ